MKGFLGLWLVAFLALPLGAQVDAGADAAAVLPAAPVEVGSFAGAWSTTYGRMDLVLDGASVSGTYPLGTLTGTVEGGRLEFRYEESSVSGRGSFELAADGLSFTGRWQPDSADDDWSVWTGTRLAEQPAALDFSGLWQTTFGPMRLRQSANFVEGSYVYAGGSSIEGAVSGNVMQFLYSEPRADGPPVEGKGVFTLDAGGRSFDGTWRALDSKTDRPWTGTRVEEDAHGRWLVILEAPWELSLGEPEYAFADMLAEYFTMAPARHVKVRRRAFYDSADLVRWCREITYTPGRVVLVLSTHGTTEGIQVGGETIGPETIADALADADNLDVLHLSGCAMMNGDVPQRIAERLSPQVRFPISGYRTTVAWDASAIGDFVYLSLILIRGLSPEAAVRAAHASAQFTGTSSDGLVKGGFGPLGLDIFVPDRDDATLDH